jgi:hypothetical protein
LEAFITAAEVSGHALYLGEGAIPNTFTVLITLNGASLSTDLAQRVVEIKLRTPEFSDDWEARVDAFINEHREAVYGDIIGFLRSPRKKIPNLTRWATREAAVLSHVDNPAKCLDLIRERRVAVDVEEEGGIVESYFAAQLRWLRYDSDCDDVFIPNATAATWYNSATGDSCKVAGVSRALRQMFSEDRTDRIVPARTSVSRDRGFRWVGEHADVDGKTWGNGSRKSLNQATPASKTTAKTMGSICDDRDRFGHFGHFFPIVLPLREQEGIQDQRGEGKR